MNVLELKSSIHAKKWLRLFSMMVEMELNRGTVEDVPRTRIQMETTLRC